MCEILKCFPFFVYFKYDLILVLGFKFFVVVKTLFLHLLSIFNFPIPDLRKLEKYDETQFMSKELFETLLLRELKKAVFLKISMYRGIDFSGQKFK